MWKTVFVIDNKEVNQDKEFPCMAPGAQTMLQWTDEFDDSTVLRAYEIKQVILDLSFTRQYVHLEMING